MSVKASAPSAAAHAPATTHLTVEQREAVGRAARHDAPRANHGAWAPAAGRADPVAILEAQAASRVPELVPIRYGRMLVSAFTFYRGAAAIMAADLAGTPTSGITVQLCGDAHLSNFGVFAAPDRRLVFDLNDFDETLEGPWEWDVKRLAASLEIAGRDRAFTPKQRRSVVVAAVRQYRLAMHRLAALGDLAVWYVRTDVDEFIREFSGQVAKADVKAARKAAAKAGGKDSLRATAKLAERVDGKLRFVSNPPLITPVSELLPEHDAQELQDWFRELVERYAQTLTPDRRHLVSGYRFVDIARKVVGVGSVGTRAWVVLLEGRDEGDVLVLQAKEADASVLEAHLEPSPYANHGERVVQGQRFMQAASDIFLGWEHVTGIDGVERDFYLRQLWDGKGSVVVETMAPERLELYGRLCGATLARGHARSGDRVAIAAYLGNGDAFDRAIAEFSALYADCNDRDYAALKKAVTTGRIEARAEL